MALTWAQGSGPAAGILADEPKAVFHFVVMERASHSNVSCCDRKVSYGENQLPATITTKEDFPKDEYTAADMRKEAALRIKAGAIRSSHESKDGKTWCLSTEWNVIGEND